MERSNDVFIAKVEARNARLFQSRIERIEREELDEYDKLDSHQYVFGNERKRKEIRAVVGTMKLDRWVR